MSGNPSFQHSVLGVAARRAAPTWLGPAIGGPRLRADSRPRKGPFGPWERLSPQPRPTGRRRPTR
eukprot:13092626-Alexandrium_andersonii.AAC.1